MPRTNYDAIVLGTGGVGSAALWQLACRGLKVLGIDRFAAPHDRGSSHGHTRIIRQAYFEHPDYVPLLLDSYHFWNELQRQSGRSLLAETGLLQIGSPDGAVIQGVRRAAREHGLEVEGLSPDEIARRWPAFHAPPDAVGIFERRAGLLKIEDCVRAMLIAANEAGAELHAGVDVFGWTAGSNVCIETSAGRFSADRLVIAAGPWAGKLLANLSLGLEVRRKTLMWYASSDATMRASAGFPCYLFELPHGVFYGFPAIDERGLKAAEHSGGDVVADPSTVDRQLRESDQAPVDAFLRAHLPGVETPCREHAVCLYTMSPDEHFIIDRHPEHDRVVFAAGLSGHGYKFAPVLGAILADLALHGSTRWSIDFLSLRRFVRS